MHSRAQPTLILSTAQYTVEYIQCRSALGAEQGAAPLARNLAPNSAAGAAPAAALEQVQDDVTGKLAKITRMSMRRQARCLRSVPAHPLTGSVRDPCVIRA